MKKMHCDYKGITEYYMDIIADISTIIYDTQKQYIKGSDEWKEIESDYLSWYGSKEKAYYRINEILDMEDYYCEEDFQYWALEKLSEARHRIEFYINRASGLLDYTKIDYEKHDDIVIDYYQSIRLNRNGRKRNLMRKSFDKYGSIVHRRIMINLGLVRDIGDVKEAINHSLDLSEEAKQDNLEICDKMLELAKCLNGYVENSNEF